MCIDVRYIQELFCSDKNSQRLTRVLEIRYWFLVQVHRNEREATLGRSQVINRLWQ